jgi:SAM-dependent methyltransferase
MLSTADARVTPMSQELSSQYDAAFYERGASDSRKSAAVVVPLVNKLVRPESVLDVGCGVGAWLAEWVSQGVTDVLGLDGEYVDRAMLQIESTDFLPVDFRSRFSLGRRFDLVESLEVAEHLEEPYADAFVQSLASHADTVLFSAAIPGQGGTHHVNEQWPSYWVAKFSHVGLGLFDIIRPLIWADGRVGRCYRQNILIFSSQLTFDVDNARIDVVHPEYWEAEPSLRQLIGGLPTAVRSAVRNRLPVVGNRH